MVRTAHTAGFSSEEVDIRFAVIPSTGFKRRGQGGHDHGGSVEQCNRPLKVVPEAFRPLRRTVVLRPCSANATDGAQGRDRRAVMRARSREIEQERGGKRGRQREMRTESAPSKGKIEKWRLLLIITLIKWLDWYPVRPQVIIRGLKLAIRSSITLLPAAHQ